MSNTYFNLKKKVTHKLLETYTNRYELHLTAFVGGENHTQLTVITMADNEGQSGIGYIELGDNDIDLIIAGLLERRLNKITATGNEQSVYCPNIEDV